MQVLLVKRLGATNTLPARWKLECQRSIVTVSQDHYNDTNTDRDRQMFVFDYLQRFGWDTKNVSEGQLKNGDWVYCINNILDPPKYKISGRFP